MAAYVARLYLEWSRLLSPNRGEATFVYKPEMEWEQGKVYEEEAKMGF